MIDEISSRYANSFDANRIEAVSPRIVDRSDSSSGDKRKVAEESSRFGVSLKISDEARNLANDKAENKVQKEDENSLTEEEKREVEELEKRDQEVRAHEQAHIMAGGNLVRGGASYSYKTGPDGKRYIVDGEVSIDSSPIEGDPEATIRKAEQIRRAALAPADPSGQDRRVAAMAANMAAQARQEMTGEYNKNAHGTNNMNFQIDVKA
jgi:hypothetical protein